MGCTRWIEETNKKKKKEGKERKCCNRKGRKWDGRESECMSITIDIFFCGMMSQFEWMDLRPFMLVMKYGEFLLFICLLLFDDYYIWCILWEPFGKFVLVCINYFFFNKNILK